MSYYVTWKQKKKGVYAAKHFIRKKDAEKLRIKLKDEKIRAKIEVDDTC